MLPLLRTPDKTLHFTNSRRVRTNTFGIYTFQVICHKGHSYKYGADAERAEGDDTEGHGLVHSADAERSEGDHTEGHMQPPPDLRQDR
jgi:hypothetical protein